MCCEDNKTERFGGMEGMLSIGMSEEMACKTLKGMGNSFIREGLVGAKGLRQE